MHRVVLLSLVLTLVPACASQRLTNAGPVYDPHKLPTLEEVDVAVAGWRMPFQCIELSQRIESSQSRLYEGATSLLSASRTTDERRLRALESQADELGCLVQGSPYAY